MKKKLILILMMSLKISLSLHVNYFQCSYTRYFLNFFNHNERYLLECEKNKDNITIENLLIYGKALQTHSKVIMLFLADVMNSYAVEFPYSLITINLYLNNVSDSLNMIAQNNNGEKHDANNVLEGYKIIHLAIKEQLNIYINKNCNNVLFHYHMVNCDTPIDKYEYTTTNLLNINYYLKNKILTMLGQSLKRNTYKHFHPKNILFYNIMTQPIFNNKNDTIKIDNNQHIELNLLRFTPLDIQCSDSTRLTIQDVFEYMKYTFNSVDVLAYMMMVMVATFRPIAILIRNFLTLIQVVSSENSDSVTFWLKPTFINMGQQIKAYIIEFISLISYNKKFLINDVYYRFNNALQNYTIQEKLTKSDNQNNKLLIKILSNFFIRNKLYFTSDIVLNKKNITENNADVIRSQLEKNIQKVGIYMNDFRKWSSHFSNIIKNFKIRSINCLNCNQFINYKVLDRICNMEAHSEIYNASLNASMNDSNKNNIEYYKDVDAVDDKITEFNLENLNDELDEYDIKTHYSPEIQSTFKPLYKIDYLPYNM
ncbi:uncharacterized protein LOC126901060 [Daktulosphaira vitifoliae]|uniref:uncharacterized protein LOC126901060 n=1 Tax=Daktulosphaira vitifoliae TaxID=58002 RepID=UPI0021AA79B4|nr:uncharacterized protein LOC126901060 [Daktulosphaira vitifoliae]XP_050533196.1 uncharacterized protein LOC126901060 [Daktulosphaira vitifoliae]